MVNNEGKIHYQRKDDTGMAKILKYWHVVFALVALACSFAIIQNTVAQNREELGKNRADHREIFDRLEHVETVVGFLPEMRSDIKTLLREGKK